MSPTEIVICTLVVVALLATLIVRKPLHGHPGGPSGVDGDGPQGRDDGGHHHHGGYQGHGGDFGGGGHGGGGHG